MSRVVWGVVTKRQCRGGSDCRLRQTTLETKISSKRPRPVEALDVDGEGVVPQDGARWGPCGGMSRDQSRTCPPRAYMNGNPRHDVFDRTAYSREYVAAWRQERAARAPGSAAKGEDIYGLRDGGDGLGIGTNTEFDDSLLAPFLGPNCPRSLFDGDVFFLNSCDADPEISMYLLEKLIRYLGGRTSMSVTGAVRYIVAQHLSSAKETKYVESMSARAHRRSSVRHDIRYIHPHYILDCARSARKVGEGPYLTVAPQLGSEVKNFVTAAQWEPQHKEVPPPIEVTCRRREACRPKHEVVIL